MEIVGYSGSFSRLTHVCNKFSHRILDKHVNMCCNSMIDCMLVIHNIIVLYKNKNVDSKEILNLKHKLFMALNSACMRIKIMIMFCNFYF